jgi:flagellar biosynthesis/type III secretory pathway protein FliH
VLAEKQGLERGLERGREEGLEVGLERGFKKGLRRNIEDLCDLLGLELTASQREVLAKADVAELEKLRQRIKQNRRWDDP